MATGTEFSLIAFLGILLLIGIVKKNAIMMVDFALRGGAHVWEWIRCAAIAHACSLRFRPIMMTTCAAIAGALPLAIATGDGTEMRRPLGIAIVGGLIVSQLLTVYTTPGRLPVCAPLLEAPETGQVFPAVATGRQYRRPRLWLRWESPA